MGCDSRSRPRGSRLRASRAIRRSPAAHRDRAGGGGPPMTIEEFKALLRAHGADRKRWPERARVSAEALLERDPAAQALLAKAETRRQVGESDDGKADAPDRDS